MYELKILLPQFDIKLPTCMYELKNVSLSGDLNGKELGAAAVSSSIDNSVQKKQLSNGKNHTSKGASVPTPNCTPATTATTCVLDLEVLGTQIQQLLKNSQEAQQIVQRQEIVLHQLNELKAQMEGIRKALGVSGESVENTSQKTIINGGLREEPLHDIVINGHPNFIPYALLALKNAWLNLFTIDVKTFTHSTMSDIGAAAREFEEELRKVPINETIPKINVTLIWKNCEHTEMISSPTVYVPIYGEVNIIRYLGRVGPMEYRYENSPLCNEIDAVLDICYQLLRCNTPKTRANMISTLNSRLQKQQYFGGSEMSIADIGVHSSLIRIPSITDKDLTTALIAWRKRVKLVTKI